MRQIVVTQTGVGSTPPIPLDIHGWPNISLQVDVTAPGSFTLEQTLDNPFTTPPGSILWLPHPDANLVAQTVDRQGNYAYVPAALRMTLTGGGSAKLTVVQAGGPLT